MKATELMIGDLVVHISTRENGRIIGLSPDGTIGITASLDDGSKIWWALEDCIEPIPVTPEILEKNGWKRTECKSEIEYEHDDVSMFLIVEGNYVRCIIADYNRFGRIDSLGVSFAELCHLHYVHELQHALRLCGLDELADNFKI